ncbi:MAG: hypothetical protein Q7U08_03335, partial [Flavobacteriaceae bacterium]|nr:hypothetical protein [Flavobacteriaceae bacterium]
IFGLLKMALFLSVLLFYFQKLNTKTELVAEKSLQESILYAPVKEMAGMIFPSFFGKIDDSSETNSDSVTDKFSISSSN